MIKVLHVNFDAIHKGNFVYDRPAGDNYWLLLLIHTYSNIKVNDVELKYPPNTMLLYKPGQSAYYRANEETYSNDWLRFVTDDPQIITAQIPGGIPFVTRDYVYIHMLFQLLTYEFMSENDMKEPIMEKLIQTIFYKLNEAFETKPSTPLCRNLHDLQRLIYKEPSKNWTVDEMASKLNICVGHLEKIYKNTFGVTCMEDVIRSRINLAQKYLRSNDFNTDDIIQLCGYNNSAHFYRQFKRVVGMTPREYKTSQLNNRNTSWREVANM
jgi:AraC-like DNA-binding protein